ncbi:MAG: type IV secretory system conjugative DNA transfer family protein, partial [Bdellovibrionia bacterium]
MDKSSEKKDLSDDDVIQAILGFGILVSIGVILFFAFKYIIPLVLGVPLCLCFLGSKSRKFLFDGLTHFVNTLLFFSSLFYFLLGTPFRFHGDFLGVLCEFPFYNKVVLYFIRFYNGIVGDYLPKKLALKLYVYPKNLDTIDCARYLWLSLVFGLCFYVAVFAIKAFIPKKTRVKSSGGTLPSIFDGPANLVYFSFEKCVGGWFFPKTRLQILQFILKQSSSHVPPDSFFLGETTEGKPFFLSLQNLAYHIAIVGGTGSGKTNLLYNFIDFLIALGHTIIFLDFKSELQTLARIFQVAKQHGREHEIRFLSLANPDLSVPYNPLKLGDPSTIQSALMNAMTWSDPFYRGLASDALIDVLKALCEYRDKEKKYFHLGHLYTLLSDMEIASSFLRHIEALNFESGRNFSKLVSTLSEKDEKKNYMGLLSNLKQLLESTAGVLLSKEVIKGSFGIEEVLTKPTISIMLMNSLMLKESASLVGKLILQDLMTQIGKYYSQSKTGIPPRPVTLVIDEFASFATPEFIEFMDRARGAGISIILAHQARADLKSISPDFAERVEANSNTILASGIKSSDDIDHYASMLGTKESI